MAPNPPRPGLVEHLRLAAKVNDLAGTLDHLYAEYGPVADVGYRIPIRLVYLMGVDANRDILSSTRRTSRGRRRSGSSRSSTARRRCCCPTVRSTAAVVAWSSRRSR